MAGTKGTSLQTYSPTGSFAEEIMAICFTLSASIHTRRAYWTDARKWLEFTERRGIDPCFATALHVAAWVEEQKQDGGAPKSRVRRLSALSSIYDQLRRNGRVPSNPFSVADGPKREAAITQNPTPMASPLSVQALLATCDDSYEGIRDTAIFRLLWATGARRGSLVSMTFERIAPGTNFKILTVVAKGGKLTKLLVRGKALDALEAWIAVLTSRGIVKGPIWRGKSGETLDEKDIWRIVNSRAKKAGITERISPHTFRVAFLTLNPASLDSRQDAAGHSDPMTTRGYDRQWRGRDAFEAMPEVEEVDV